MGAVIHRSAIVLIPTFIVCGFRIVTMSAEERDAAFAYLENKPACLIRAPECKQDTSEDRRKVVQTGDTVTPRKPEFEQTQGGRTASPNSESGEELAGDVASTREGAMQQRALEQERQTREALVRELTSARDAAKQQQLALEQERSKREGLGRELASAREKVERLSAAGREASPADKKALQQERQRAEGLAREQQNSAEQARARAGQSSTRTRISTSNHK